MFNTRFWPITANPINPISQFASDILAFPFGVHPARAPLEKIGLEGEMIPDRGDGSKETWVAGFRHPAGVEAVFNSVTSDPTGLVTVRAAMVPKDSPRRYIMYAAAAPAISVPQNNTLLIIAPSKALSLPE
jgi:hypothetical protein